eukprot:Phypoly_transcript_10052.p1 GENE.Phypoly_transcript_10052~~Phypoly_transcript_10052.p1  ORF type:complete len:387 (+),score=28.45 Phypoly_transcript_10052:54-1214(+)
MFDHIFIPAEKYSLITLVACCMDPLSCTLSSDILEYILEFINPTLRSFALFTCSSWYHTIRSLDDNKFPLFAQAKTASHCGYTNYVKYALEHGCNLDIELARKAAFGGALDCLKYLHEQGCTWDGSVSAFAALGGHLETLQYLKESGCKTDPCALQNAVAANSVPCLDYLLKNGLELNKKVVVKAAHDGSFDCLKYLLERGCPWGSSAANEVTKKGNLQILKLAADKGYKLNAEKICLTAASEGHLDILRFFRETRKYKFDDFVKLKAAEYGKLACLKYIHESGADWHERTCEKIAKYGHVDCLRYAYENGCDWDVRTCLEAVSNSHWPCLKFAYENGCPWPAYTEKHENNPELECRKGPCKGSASHPSLCSSYVCIQSFYYSYSF